MPVQPISGTTDFEDLTGGPVAIGDATGNGLAATNVDGWDFLLTGSTSSAGVYVDELDFASKVIVGASGTSDGVSTFLVKPADGSTFTLNTVDIAVAQVDDLSHMVGIILTGYRNGLPVAGATLSQTLYDAFSMGPVVTFDVAANAAFAGIDSFTISTDGSAVIRTFGVDNIHATNFGFAPILVPSAGAAAFVEGDHVVSIPVPVDPGLTLADPDSATLASATVSITAGFHAGEDILGFINEGTTQGNIAGSYDAETGELTLTSSGATATVAEWTEALRAVTYTDTALAPDEATRTISFTVDDGVYSSLAAMRSLSVTATPQTPITPETTSIYRFFDSASGTHFYTTSLEERNAIIDPSSPGYQPKFVSETNGFAAIDPAANDPDMIAVYRFFDSSTGAHFMTSSVGERDDVMNPVSANYQANYVYEPEATFYEHATQHEGDVAVYRLFDTHDGTHLYTSDRAELAGITTSGSATYRPDLIQEGIAFYAPVGSITS